MWNDPIELIEHHRRPVPALVKDKLDGLEQYLNEVWQTRTLFYDEDPRQPVSARQPFLEFGYEPSKGQVTMKAGRYVGFIQYEGITIQILPKLFGKGQADQAFRHLLWWMDYNNRVRFPFADLLTGNEPVDNFPEALIRYFARYTTELVASSPFHQYEELTETMSYLRGRLNTQAYVTTSLGQGNWHQLVCDHEPFQFNNRLNQIIKYVARQLGNLCRSETLRDLERVVFLLDEVDDLPATVQDCDRIQVSRFFQEYEHCLAMCRFFLTNEYLNRQDEQQRHFCFLVPMDMVYEDFIAGVVRTELGHQYRVQTQATDWLTGEKVFQIRNDLLLTDERTKAKLVVDTKYKVRSYEQNDPKAGISQTDLYQMVSYGLRRHTRQVVLLYPRQFGQEPQEPQRFTVNSGLMDNQPIQIQAVDLTVTGQVRTQKEFKEEVVRTVLCGQLTEAFKLVDQL
jgi:5-methylcytosine-specific restriction enzyme subunit McrC